MSTHQDVALRPKAPAGSLRELLQVAIPLVLSSGSHSLLYVVDRIFLTWHSEAALAAVLPAGILHFTVVSLAFGIALYVNTFVAQYEGAGHRDRVAASVWQGFYFSILAGALLAACAPAAEPLFRWIGHDPPVQKLEAAYFAILCLGSAPLIASTALSCFFSGRGKTMTVMFVNVTVAGVNMGLDYCLIFGIGPFPEMGIRGAALATVIANIVSVGLFAGGICYGPHARDYAVWRHWRIDRELLMRMIRYGFPNGIMLFIDLAIYSLFVLLIGFAGKTALAATNLAFNLNTLAFIPMLGMGTAIMTLVGIRIGEGRADLAVRTTWIAFALAGTYMILFAGIYLLLPDVILAPYTVYSNIADFETIRNHVVLLLRFVAVYSFFDAMAIVFGAAVRGAGDTRFSMMFNFVAGLVIMLIPMFFIWHLLGPNLIIGWTVCTAYIIVLGVGFLLRFLGGRWKSMRVIEPVSPAPVIETSLEDTDYECEITGPSPMTSST